MNRSHYVPQNGFPPSPYNPQQSYGAAPQPSSQMQGMAHHPSTMTPPGYGNPPPGMGESPIQPSLSPSTMWTTANFTNGPIIEDLCAPPPPPMGMFSVSPPMNAFPPGMTMGPMHPGAMPQLQAVYGGIGMRHHPGSYAAPGMLPHAPPGQGAMQGGIPSTRILGTYPPYTGQQHGYAYPPRPMDPNMNMNGMLGRPRLETGFHNPVPSSAPPAGNAAVGMGHVGSPHMEGSPGGDGMPPLTPVEEALREFLSTDLGNLGRHGS
ncbi:hypothetical protein N658DRAFT_501734 [Parathielavia hyrcaniae]|uniref:Uncharacterized protein n=1 Tax=Parathielavia hyrcaniae TaxID=113614 RepID=A0AAN6PQW3_9PEZI|nr:hypothetical protein N658DRAFT_501734 [Parathielavia hyrcaniae]